MDYLPPLTNLKSTSSDLAAKGFPELKPMRAIREVRKPSMISLSTPAEKLSLSAAS